MDETLRDSLNKLRKSSSPFMELGFADFSELNEAEQKEFIFRSLFRIGEWIEYFKMQQHKGK